MCKNLINFGDLSKPANTLIEKISDAIEGISKPFQIKRVAKAEIEAEIIKVKGEEQISELRHRALNRFINEEAKKQNNIENITQKSIPLLKENSQPNEIQNDWITNFFDKCRIISDEEMQLLWAKILSGEANSPGTYSKRTVNLLNSLDKNDTLLFTQLCRYCWQIGHYQPLIFNFYNQIYHDQGISFDSLCHLEAIGLINFVRQGTLKRMGLSRKITIFYHGMPLNIEFKKESKNDLHTGLVSFTNVGQEFKSICAANPLEGFQEYTVREFMKNGLILSSPYPKVSMKEENKN